MHSPLIRHQSLRHFSIKAFQRVAAIRSQDPEAFVRFERQGEKSGRVTYKKFGRGSRTACLIERGSQVLMVAHVDTVLEPRKEAEIFADRLFHNAIDNRLGVYLGLAVLPAMGLNVDLLLTRGEEDGASSAAMIRPQKQYRWMFSFDRRGDDVVCYQYECASLAMALGLAGFTVSDGSYSCIAELEHLGCCGMNFACGMFNYHSDDAYCDLAMLEGQLRRFTAFYNLYAGLHLPHRRALEGGVEPGLQRI
jgi:hypothetical protein